MLRQLDNTVLTGLKRRRQTNKQSDGRRDYYRTDGSVGKTHARMRVNRQRLLKSSSQYTVTLTSRTSPSSQAYRFKATIQFPSLFTYRTQHLVLYLFFCLQPRLRTDVGLLHSIMIVIYRPSSIIKKCFWRKLTLWTKKRNDGVKKNCNCKTMLPQNLHCAQNAGIFTAPPPWKQSKIRKTIKQGTSDCSSAHQLLCFTVRLTEAELAKPDCCSTNIHSVRPPS